MSNRYMRVIVLFDLPSITNREKKIYHQFHHYLEKEGFVMMQESVYTKLVLNGSVAKSIITKIKNNTPAKGLVQLLTITEKQYSQIECITGQYHSNHIESEERLIII